MGKYAFLNFKNGEGMERGFPLNFEKDINKNVQQITNPNNICKAYAVPVWSIPSIVVAEDM